MREKEELERDKESLSVELEYATSAYDERRKRSKDETTKMQKKLQEKDAEIHSKQLAINALHNKLSFLHDQLEEMHIQHRKVCYCIPGYIGGHLVWRLLV